MPSLKRRIIGHGYDDLQIDKAWKYILGHIVLLDDGRVTYSQHVHIDERAAIEGGSLPSFNKFDQATAETFDAEMDLTIATTQALKVNATLTSLDVLANRLTEAGARALVAMAESKPNQIKSLCGIAADAMEVDFSRWRLDPAGAVLLAFDLRVNATVIKLEFQSNEIGAVGAQHIAEALKGVIKKARAALAGYMMLVAVISANEICTLQ
ncbi:hypothetical protein T492DRAFT_898832 [Pavlovales sp. CCMP2436]|nr:hypothetical protein T492DRAFT_898832 [Pavlovales sp. CCMP2436]